MKTSQHYPVQPVPVRTPFAGMTGSRLYRPDASLQRHVHYHPRRHRFPAAPMVAMQSRHAPTLKRVRLSVLVAPPGVQAAGRPARQDSERAPRPVRHAERVPWVISGSRGPLSTVRYALPAERPGSVVQAVDVP